MKSTLVYELQGLVEFATVRASNRMPLAYMLELRHYHSRVVHVGLVNGLSSSVNQETNIWMRIVPKPVSTLLELTCWAPKRICGVLSHGCVPSGVTASDMLRRRSGSIAQGQVWAVYCLSYFQGAPISLNWLSNSWELVVRSTVLIETACP